MARALPFFPLALVLLHIGPGVVVDFTLLVAVFALFQVGIFRPAIHHCC
ncbi:MAG: hypothetical protein WA709_20575 [Stellaceae bacterium]